MLSPKFPGYLCKKLLSKATPIDAVPVRLYFVNLLLLVDTKVLLLRRSGNYKSTDFGAGYYDLPGGRLDQGETPLEALRREVQEEISRDLADFQDLRYLGVEEMALEAYGFVRCNHLYTCRTAEVFEVVLSLEHTGFVWMELAAAVELEAAIFAVRRGLERVLTGK